MIVLLTCLVTAAPMAAAQTKGDIAERSAHVRFNPESGRQSHAQSCLLWTTSVALCNRRLAAPIAALHDESTVANHLGHAAGHETTDPYAFIEPVTLIALDIDWPDHCPPGPVRLSDDGTIRHDNPQHVF